MWCEKKLLNAIQKFLPPTSQIVLLKKLYERAALELIDLDGDGVSELVCAYYWHGEYYIIILKYQENHWNVLDTVKGKGYNTTYWDYFADAQIKTGNTKEACNSVEKALSAEYPYPSVEKLMELKNSYVKIDNFLMKKEWSFQQ